MSITRRILRPPIWLTAVLVAAVVLTGVAPTLPPSEAKSRAVNTNPPPFDFSDAFYRQNGIDPAKIRERVGNPDRNPSHWTVDTSNTDPNRRPIRILETTGGWNDSANLIYYTVMGAIMDDAFERDALGNLTARGARAKQIAENARAFLFPKASAGSVLDPAPPNRRQDNIFDTRGGYFSNNPLGLWVLTFVVYTPKAFTEEGRKILDPIAARNGRDLDGTPIIKSASQVDDLASKGLVELRQRPRDGSQGVPWVI